jgi:hypothetical protein
MCASNAAPPRDGNAGGTPGQNAEQACAALLDQVGGSDPAALPDHMIQRLLTFVVRAYAAKLDAGEPFEPFTQDSGLTASDVCPAVARMLKAVDIDLFELVMWQHLVDR